MSWKTKLKAKRFSLILLLMLIVSLAFNVYGYYSIYTQSTGQFNIQLSSNTELKLQLDSATYMIIHAQSDFNASGYWITTTDTTGDLEFETNVATVLNFYWLGNVSNVLFGRVDIGLGSIANATDHSLTNAKTYRLTWDWQGAFAVPPPSEYAYQAVAYDENLSLPFEGLPFTMTVNDTWTYDYTTTRLDFLDSQNEYKFVFPSSYELDANTTMVFDYIQVNHGGSYYNVSESTVYIIPTDYVTLTVYYYEIPTVTFEPLLPITFIMGMVGLGCLFFGPIYGIMKFRAKDYRNGFIYGVIIFAVGFALFMGWLWH